jgi:Flp pilus assembly protein TadD
VVSEEIVPNQFRKSTAVTKSASQAVAPRAKDRRVVLAVAAVLVLATAAAYHDSFSGPFVFDDDSCISENPSIQHLSELGAVLSPPGDSGITVSGRPVLNLSLAINYALGGKQVPGYHLMNFVIHILAGLVLFGIVRRTLLLPSMRGAMLPSSEAWRATVERPGHASADGRMAPDMAPYLAGTIAMLWMVHPLQTESVTYIVQRAESLMGLFYLLTLYCVIRASESRLVLWSLAAVAAVAACATGMATKEVMATAPLIVLLYDRTFLAGSFRQALRKRWGLYAGLFACWGLLAYLVASTGNRGGTAGFGAEMVPGWWSYAQTECGAILHYLSLTFWPDALCLDYGRSYSSPLWEILTGAVLVSGVAVATIWGLCRGRKWGFLGAWFLAILAPTSSVIPIRDPLFEHRMYLPLAAVVSAVVLGAFLMWRKIIPGAFPDAVLPSSEACRATVKKPRHASEDGSMAPGMTWRFGQWAAPCLALVVVAGALGYRTALRNTDYQSAVVIWQSAVGLRPSNARAHCNLGRALKAQGDYDPAIEQFRLAIGLDSRYALAYCNLGVALLAKGDYAPAVEQLRQAVRLKPQFTEAYYNLGVALCAQGKFQEAVPELQIAIRLNPQFPAAYNNLGMAWVSLGKLEDAIEQFRQAIRADPRFLDAYENLATTLSKAGRDQEAQEVRKQTRQNCPELSPGHVAH